jgi:hypothetical protein
LMLWCGTWNFFTMTTPAPILRQMNSTHFILYYIFKIYFNVILKYMHRSSKSSLSLRFAN